MKQPFKYVLLSGICALLLLPGCDQVASPPQVKRPPPEVTVVIAHAGSVPLTREPVGLLAATQTAQVRARVAGIILRRVYTEGAEVRQGQVLFEIDPAPLQASLHAEEAVFSKARADATNAGLIARRYQDLAAKGLLASQDLDTALANERTTAALVKEAQANVEKARLNLGYATVKAPIAGHAGRALVTEGALVGQGEATELTTIEQIDPIYVNFSQSVGELPQWQQAAITNQSIKVQVILPDGTPFPYPGTLDFSARKVDHRTGAVSLRAVVPNQEQRLLPGMFVKLRVTVGHLEHAFLLPQATLQRDQAGAYVLVVGAAGKVEQRRVQTHGMTRTDWIVSGHLTDGDQVIMDGLQKVKPGALAMAIQAADTATSQATEAPVTRP